MLLAGSCVEVGERGLLVVWSAPDVRVLLVVYVFFAHLNYPVALEADNHVGVVRAVAGEEKVRGDEEGVAWRGFGGGGVEVHGVGFGDPAALPVFPQELRRVDVHVVLSHELDEAGVEVGTGVRGRGCGGARRVGSHRGGE